MANVIFRGCQCDLTDESIDGDTDLSTGNGGEDIGGIDQDDSPVLIFDDGGRIGRGALVSHRWLTAGGLL